ncbi:hypothetical protein GOP47_0020419 [Adiantum capillus-veneris]|uniref:Peptidase S54 rhomboid domain-containing protein n=1 Tax=Adiantum capillus-veneris TaxID=13818 RepID=A0A9D4Z8N9_ADICA|nr:hypothetical protein GOP47_0020419 [Adiantum capillus-veneris]
MMSVCRALRQRNGSFPPSIATLLNAHTTESESASRSSYPRIDASFHTSYGFRAEIRHHLTWSHLRGCGHNPCASGLRAMHWIASTNYHQLGYNRDNGTSFKDCKLLAARGERPRFFTSGLVTMTLIAANVAVSTMWWKMNPRFMDTHFMVSYESFIHGRLHTLITSAFSHFKSDHLLWNMVGLYCFGGMIERMYGGPMLFIIYLFGGICGSLGHILYYLKVYPWIKNIPLSHNFMMKTPGALGASGAVTSLTLLFILNYPTHTILLMGFPMPAALVGCIIVGKDVYGAIQGGGDISVGGHLGGALSGAAIFLLAQSFLVRP